MSVAGVIGGGPLFFAIAQKDLFQQAGPYPGITGDSSSLTQAGITVPNPSSTKKAILQVTYATPASGGIGTITVATLGGVSGTLIGSNALFDSNSSVSYYLIDVADLTTLTMQVNLNKNHFTLGACIWFFDLGKPSVTTTYVTDSTTGASVSLTDKETKAGMLNVALSITSGASPNALESIVEAGRILSDNSGFMATTLIKYLMDAVSNAPPYNKIIDITATLDEAFETRLVGITVQ